MMSGMFLMQVRNPWGYNNKDLLTMYQGPRPMGSVHLLLIQAHQVAETAGLAAGSAPS